MRTNSQIAFCCAFFSALCGDDATHTITTNNRRVRIFYSSQHNHVPHNRRAWNEAVSIPMMLPRFSFFSLVLKGRHRTTT